MQRIVEEEWLDQDGHTAKDIEAALHSIRLANRRFGGDRLHARSFARALARVPGRQQPQILEVASGRGDVLRCALQRLRIAAEVTLLDRSPLHLPDQRTWPAEIAPRSMVGNALELPFTDGSVDIVSCCLFLHHLEPREVTRFLTEAVRVARVAVVINDLERTATHYRLARINRFMDRSRISRHDGPVSVRRAYTYRELAGMLAESGRRFLLERAYLFRLGAVVWCV